MNCHLGVTLNSRRQSVLVVGYGSLLRSDDGVGQQVATEVMSWQAPHVQAIAVHQLTPELADRLAKTDVVIFVDAYPALAESEVQVHPLTLSNSVMTMGHWCEPSVLLTMTQVLYSHYPQAWWIGVPGVNFELGKTFSAIAKQGVENALQQIAHLIQAARIESCTKLG
ncbi:MAG TPA: hydrogenase maturation protease [Coleofasciculaceae cyanobacterium]